MPAHLLRRAGVLGTLLVLILGLLAPSLAAAAPGGRAASYASRSEASAAVRTSTSEPIFVRDLSWACPEGRVPRSGFRDVPSGSTFARAVDCLVGFAITRGRTAASYAPNDRVTRQQMAVFLHRMLDDLLVLPPVPARSRFVDVVASGEAAHAIEVLASDELAQVLGTRIVAGRTATRFDPTAPVTRAQMAAFIARTFEAVLLVKGFEIADRGDCSGVFADERTIPLTHREAVFFLCAGGIVTGRRDGTYGPAADVTRGQMAAFLMRTMDALVEATVATPADRRSEVHVDRGDGDAACTGTDRDGSLARPYCTIGEGIAAAGRLRDHAVRVVIAGRSGGPAYAGDVLLSAGRAHAVDLVGAAPDGGRVPVAGRIRVEGTAFSFHTLGRLQVTAPTAIDVRTAGYLALTDLETRGTRGVLLDQPRSGLGYVLASELRSSSTSVDAVRAGMLVARGTRFATATDAFVALPAGLSAVEADRLFARYFLDPALGNRFDRRTVRGTLADGRRALVPAS
jgi:hypothetical protein